MTPKATVLGLMSGTSCDGVSAAIVRFIGRPPAVRFRLLYNHTFPYPPRLRATLRAASGADVPTLCALNFELGDILGKVAARAISESGLGRRGVDLIGSHGHTVWHVSPRAGRRADVGRAAFPSRPSTLQIGEPAFIVERTGVPVVADFRPRDMAAGGEGAPLVPFADWVFFGPGRRDARPRRRAGVPVALNIGGIANVTVLAPRLSDVVAFDTGPGNCLIDEAAQLASHGATKYDSGGRLAACGKIDQRLLDGLLAHEYFALRPPKSTGREVFNLPALQLDIYPSPHLVPTLTELTAVTIHDAVKRFVARGRDFRGSVESVIVGGGGAKNGTLMRRLAALFEPVPVVTTETYGVPIEAREAMAFALLAYCTHLGVPSNVSSATGARNPVVLGKICR
ncbi:MAG: anhydro-N-acetylmuramic acid kinase [Planctomycetota bacterium]|nr:anhydro-N-acetylmuramic acid kinase [Planctomycetota bacterium]